MNASKEQAEIALKTVETIMNDYGVLGPSTSSPLVQLKEFVLAAKRKLPREASYLAEKSRGRCKHQESPVSYMDSIT